MNSFSFPVAISYLYDSGKIYFITKKTCTKTDVRSHKTPNGAFRYEFNTFPLRNLWNIVLKTKNRIDCPVLNNTNRAIYFNQKFDLTFWKTLESVMDMSTNWRYISTEITMWEQAFFFSVWVTIVKLNWIKELNN